MINLLSLFSGIGAFERALDLLNLHYNLIGYCEIDKYASKGYALIHGVNQSKNFGDIRGIGVNNIGPVDLITYGFPCQDISIIGPKNGFIDDKGQATRSGLFFDALRIIEGAKPKFAIAENVKALTSKRFQHEFKEVLSGLNNAGYNSYYSVLNAKDYGLPQNRERVFIVSIRRDIDRGFVFPNKQTLTIDLASMLDSNVSPKYYLSERQINGYLFSTQKAKDRGNGFKFEPTNGHTIAHAITTRAGSRGTDNYIQDEHSGKIRRLTPAECFKVMGFNAHDAKLLQESGISDTQLYKMAGNSISVNVLVALLGELIKQYDL